MKHALVHRNARRAFFVCVAVLLAACEGTPPAPDPDPAPVVAKEEASTDVVRSDVIVAPVAPEDTVPEASAPAPVDATLEVHLDDLGHEVELTRIRARNALIKEILRGRGDEVAAALATREWSGVAAEEANRVLFELGPPGIRAFAADLRGGADTHRLISGWANRFGSEAIPLIRARAEYLGTLDDDDVLWSINRLDGQGGEFAPELLQLVRSNPRSAERVVYALRGLGAAAVPLARHLLSDGRPEIRMEVLENVYWMGEAIDGLHPELVRCIHESASSDELQQAARVLAKLGRVEQLLEIVREKHEAGQLTEALLVTLHYDAEGSAAFVRKHGPTWLRHTDGGVRATALGLLTMNEVELDPPETVELLLASMNDPDLRVVARAVQGARWELDHRPRTVPAVGALVRRLANEGKHDAKELGVVLLEAATFLATRNLRDIDLDLAGDVSLVVDHPELWLPDLAILRAARGDRDDVGWIVHCGNCAESAVRELKELLRLLRSGDSDLSREASESLWFAVAVAPKEALRVLSERGGLSPDDLDRWLDVVRKDGPEGPDALRYVEDIVDSDAAAARTLEVVLPLVAPDREDVSPEALEALFHLWPRAASAREALLDRAVDSPELARALGAMGPKAIHAAMRRVEKEPEEVREAVRSGLLAGVRLASEVATKARTQASCRVWLLARYGPLRPSTGLPRDIPAKRTGILRWAVRQATGDE